MARHKAVFDEDASPDLNRVVNNILGNIGYSPEGAIFELIDNSIESGATRVNVQISIGGRTGRGSRITVFDNGSGVPRDRYKALCQIASDRKPGRRKGDIEALGKFGTGLKSAKVFLCNEAVVFTKTNKDANPVYIMPASLRATVYPLVGEDRRYFEDQIGKHGTMIRLFSLKITNDEVATLKNKLGSILGVYYNRFIRNPRTGRQIVRLFVDGKEVEAFDPLWRERVSKRAPTDKDVHLLMDSKDFDIQVSAGQYVKGTISVTHLPYMKFVSNNERKRYKCGGNERYGSIYVYRNDRLVQTLSASVASTKGFRTLCSRTELLLSSDDADGLVFRDLKKSHTTVSESMSLSLKHILHDALNHSIDLFNQSYYRFKLQRDRELAEAGLNRATIAIGKKLNGEENRFVLPIVVKKGHSSDDIWTPFKETIEVSSENPTIKRMNEITAAVISGNKNASQMIKDFMGMLFTSMAKAEIDIVKEAEEWQGVFSRFRREVSRNLTVMLEAMNSVRRPKPATPKSDDVSWLGKMDTVAMKEAIRRDD